MILSEKKEANLLYLLSESISLGILLGWGGSLNSFKLAIIQPLLKGPHLDPTVHINYRPIAKLSFVSKVLENVALSQFTSYLDTFNILDPFQYGSRALHSTESALLKVTNDILLSIDSGSCAILILLDLSATFDTVDQDILLKRLECVVGEFRA